MNNKLEEGNFISFVSPKFIRVYINLKDNFLIVHKSQIYQNKKNLVNFKL